MAIDSVGDRLLLLFCQCAQGVGERHAEAALVEPMPERLAERLGQREPLRDPAALPTADLGDGRRPELLGVPQVPDHTGLVHGRERARWAVGLEQGDLLVHRRTRLLHHDRHLAQAEPSPMRKALETVEQLVFTVVGGDHPQRDR